jgi:lysozyme family protein
MASIRKTLDKILPVEGKYSNDPKDPGGETVCGISRVYWPKWPGWKIVDANKTAGKHPLSDDLYPVVDAFYEANFWDVFAGDALDQELADECFDQAINLGASKVAFHMQMALNLLNRNQSSWPDILEDGNIGPATLNVLRKADIKEVIFVMNALQSAHYIKVCLGRPSQERFLRGWMKRTIV